MKKILLSLTLSLIMSVPAFAATTIGDWAASHSTPDYEGTQRTTAAAGKAANGIVFSRHNLSSYGEHYQATTSITGSRTKYSGIAPLSVATTEICVFCHTPHFGKTDSAPLWNRGSSASGYTAYGTTSNPTTVGGTTITFSATTGGSSLACLSCHDGVTTLDNLINKPGKSGITAGGADAGWVFSEVGEYIGDTNDVSTGLAGKDKSRLNIGDGGYNAGTAGRTGNVNLQNDHPINVLYNDGVAISAGNVGRASLRPTSTILNNVTIDNARFNDSDANRGMTADGYYGNSGNLWASRGAISNTVTIDNLLRDNGKVQCASCHDPHYKNQTNTDPSVVCSYFPKLVDRNGTHAVYGTYSDEVDSPTLEGCTQAATGSRLVVTTSPALVWTNGVDTLSTTLDDMSAFLTHYMTDVDSDGLFLRRVGGNSNSGVCRTCHAK